MFKLPKWSAENPLGIIALFISLIYGMSALLLGTSIDSLEPHNETILVVFTVVFPFVVLGVFGWLVANHHKKLYGPKDFKSDESFLIANGNEDPAALGERLKREVVEVNQTDSDEGQGKGSREGPTCEAKTQRSRIHEAYIAESLVFQDLQNEFGGAVMREVTLMGRQNKQYRVDGVIRNDDRTTIIEVKFIRGSYPARRVREVYEQLRHYKDQFHGVVQGKVDYMAVFVVDSHSRMPTETIDSMINIQATEGIGYRVYNYSSLIEKYGFADN